MEKMKNKLIVLTGGPCAGKTSISDVMGHAFKRELVIVPEAASLLFKGGFPRWEELESRCALQRAIYHTQKALEKANTCHHEGKILLLDRGSIDGAAYWPNGTEDFFKSFNTTLDKELMSYDSVIYLESASKQDYNAHKRNNPNRTETWVEAHDLDMKNKKNWGNHRKMHFIHNKRAFSEKISEVMRIIENILSE